MCRQSGQSDQAVQSAKQNLGKNKPEWAKVTTYSEISYVIYPKKGIVATAKTRYLCSIRI